MAEANASRVLARLPGALLSAAVLALAASDLHAESRDQWSVYGGDPANTRYSGLAQINTGNVATLKAAWSLQLGALKGQESTPLVIGGTMYVTTSMGPRYVYALDAKTGAVRWRYAPDIADDVAPTVCCGLVNRGAAYANGRLFVARLDGILVALDAGSGRELWRTTVVDYRQGAAMTSPPLLVKNLVITGYAGGEYGMRGAIIAYDQNSGGKVWRTDTVPAPGEPGSETWSGDSGAHGGGDAWYVGTYDPALDLIYYGTGNASPWNGGVRGPDSGDYGRYTNLYSAGTLALRSETGRIAWFYQTTPHDVWDYDGVNEAVLADLAVAGRMVPALMKADRNGFFYVLDRRNGTLISATPFVPVTWASGIDRAGRPVEVPEKRPRLDVWARGVCPGLFGGKNWHPMSYSPRTGYVYIPSFNLCMDIVARSLQPWQPGRLYLGADYDLAKLGPGDGMGAMQAWDPVRQRAVWRVAERLPYVGGALSTAGGLVFYGNMQGELKAVDALSGAVLWRFAAGSGISQGPITYAIGGRQYVAVVCGRLDLPRAFRAAVGERTLAALPEGGAVFAFALP
jgi:alcohol dehydrogenase (cytochrome c)